MSKKVKRLYRQFQPESYDLSLVVDPDAMTFAGTAVITGKKSDRPSERLTFHQKDLKITTSSIVRHDKRGDTEISVKRINTHGSFDEVRIHSGELLYPGRYTITLEFQGSITRAMNGIYPCFFEHDKKAKKLIATQFESHSAREAFPCIDEPEAKAVFNLTLTTPKGQSVIANTPIKEQSTQDTKTTTIFEATPCMSTYLLAFVVGELEYKERITKGGIRIRTYATPDNVAHTEFALDCAVRTLEFYNEYFDIPYPLGKCDFIALPDFAAGAMENWGCITFREQALLVDPANTSLSLKQYVAMVVAHELTHQWFGNLVTMRWWNDLWLNESFASWMAYLATDALFPDWSMWTQFVVDEQQAAFLLDALEHTHPIEVTINHPDEIHTIFDAISYEKGASVLQMLHDYLGAEMFRDGLRLYLKEHAYKNTSTADLWHALQAVSHKPVSSFMEHWTQQPGFPIISAVVEDTTLSLRQERLYINSLAHKQADVLWPIPLHPTLPLIHETLTDKQVTYTIPIDHHQLLLNRSRTGFYRVIYNSSHLQKLGEAIRAGRVSPLDRLGLLSDTFEAAKAGYIDTIDALHLLESYVHEDSPLVWDIISLNLTVINEVMDDDALREAIKPYIRKLTHEQVNRLGWEEKISDTHFDRLLRPTVLAMAAYADNPATIKEALRQFEAMQHPEDINPDIRGVVYDTVARCGDEKTFNKLLAMYDKTRSSEERVTIASALTAFTQPALIDKALSLVLTDTVRLQDIGYWIRYSFMNHHAKQQTWKWMVDNWVWLAKNLGKDLSFFRMPLYAAQAFSDKNFLPTYTAFFTSATTPVLERSIKQGIETIEWHVAWKERDMRLIKVFFAKQEG